MESYSGENLVTDKIEIEKPEPDAGNFIHRIVRGILKALSPLISRLPAAYLRSILYRIIAQRTASLSPEEALCFLFRLDADLYPLQSQAAIDYDGGIHTKHRHTDYHRFFVERIKPGERVLDIGCGKGEVAFAVAEKIGAIVTGIDLDEEKITQARQVHAHPKLEFQVGDALKLNPDQPYDVIILSNVLEHLPGRPDFLKRIREATRPSRILIRVPTFERDWRVPLKREIGVEWRLDVTHETEYTLESFMEEMELAGLKIKHLEVRWGEIWTELIPHDA